MRHRRRFNVSACTAFFFLALTAHLGPLLPNVFSQEPAREVAANLAVGRALICAAKDGIVVAAIGCLRGLQTKSGASAVGESTTRAVVSGLVLITLVDGVFAVVFYALGI